MRLTPVPPTIGETDGFTSKNDLFKLSGFGERLANLVSNVDEPLVIAFDGPWGSGKSTFVRQWAGLLRQRGMPVILFDAFANDHQEDAFIALAGEITALTQTLAGKRGKPLTGFVRNAKKAGRVLLPLAVKTSLRAGTLGVLSADDLKELGEGAKAIMKGAADDAAAVAEQMIEDRLKRAKADRDALDAFRGSLRELAGHLSQQAANEQAAASEQAAVPAGPLVIIIDELDRCRPPFALSLLERIKHLFSVEGVCFMLVTHLGQLEAVVRGGYGADTDARTYLEKFFQLRITLPKSQQHGESERQRYIGYLWANMDLKADDHELDNSIRAGLLTLSDLYDLSLRTLERIAGHIALAYAASNKRQLRLAPLLVGLCVMRQVAPELYAKARSSALTWREAKDFFHFDAWDQSGRVNWFENWWRYATAEQLPDEEWVRQLTQVLSQYSVRDPRDLQRWTAAFIDELQIQQS